MSQIQYFAIVRHGEYYQLPDTPSADQPFPLTPEGEAAAGACAHAIQAFCHEKSLDRCFPLHCSASLRAWQTASILSKKLGHTSPPLETFSLGERSVGTAANLTVSEIERAVAADPRYPNPPPNWKSDSHYCLPYKGAESLLQAGQRVANHITDTLNHPDNQDKSQGLHVFVGHGASFRHAMFHLGVLTLEEAKGRSMYHAKPVFFRRKDSGVWQHIAGEWKPRSKAKPDMD